MNLSDIPILMHRVKYNVRPPFAAIAASTLLRRLCAGLLEFLNILPQAQLPASQSPLEFIPKVFCRPEYRTRTLCRPVRLFHTKLAHSCLCGPCFVHSRVGTGNNNQSETKHRITFYLSTNFELVVSSLM